MSAFRYHADLTNCALYTTGVPCAKCAQMIVQSGIKTVVYGGKNERKKSANKMEKAAKEMNEAAIAMKVDADNTAEVLKKVAEIVERAAEVLNKSAGGTEEDAWGTEKAVERMKYYAEKMRHVAEGTVTGHEQIKSEMQKFADEMKEMKKEAEEKGKITKMLAGLARFICNNCEDIVRETEEGGAKEELKDKAIEIQNAFQKAAENMKADAEKMSIDDKDMMKEAEEIFYWAKVATL